MSEWPARHLPLKKPCQIALKITGNYTSPFSDVTITNDGPLDTDSRRREVSPVEDTLVEQPPFHAEAARDRTLWTATRTLSSNRRHVGGHRRRVHAGRSRHGFPRTRSRSPRPPRSSSSSPGEAVMHASRRDRGAPRQGPCHRASSPPPVALVGVLAEAPAPMALAVPGRGLRSGVFGSRPRQARSHRTMPSL